jgi:hypothetical protein
VKKEKRKKEEKNSCESERISELKKIKRFFRILLSRHRQNNIKKAGRRNIFFGCNKRT